MPIWVKRRVWIALNAGRDPEARSRQIKLGEEAGAVGYSSDKAPHWVHDSNVLEELLDENDQTLYADSAYKSADNDELLRNRKIKNMTQSKAKITRLTDLPHC
ncbi:MAG: hypothetical protein F7B06_11050 [Opitutae bacterium]|nr:hypothetical protein [Opitutae bacterium]